jgi:hypothetical protein
MARGWSVARQRGHATAEAAMHWYDLAGNVGVTLIVAAYLLLQLERVTSNSLPYLAANATGAALILLSLFYEFNLPAFLMEAFWLAISVMGLVRRAIRPPQGQGGAPLGPR